MTAAIAAQTTGGSCQNSVDRYSETVAIAAGQYCFRRKCSGLGEKATPHFGTTSGLSIRIDKS